MSTSPQVQVVLDAFERRLIAFQSVLRAHEYEMAARIAIAARRDAFPKPHQASDLHLTSILRALRISVNGLRDFANLHILVEHPEHPQWFRHPKAVETAWHLIHDSYDRLLRGLLHEAFVAPYVARLDYLKSFVNTVYGPGLYTSAEITSDKLICSICKSDIRACQHIVGWTYGGQPCQVMWGDDSYINAVALVSNPRDPRCRIWPWQFQDKEEGDSGSIVKAPIFILFSLESDDDNHGAVLDPVRFFSTDKEHT